LNKQTVVFAPHPDDETLGCGGTIIKKIKEGYNVVIVVMTDGKDAFLKVLGIDSDPTPKELKQIRRKEVLRATEILGVPKTNLLFLDFEDGKLRKQKEETEQKIMEILKKYNPEEVYFPSDKDYNTDHQVTSQTVQDSIRKIGLTTKAYKYSITQKYARIGPLKDRFLNLFKRIIIHVDISMFLLQKEAAIKEYKSQLTLISSKQDRPVLIDIKRFLKKTETFYI